MIWHNGQANNLGPLKADILLNYSVLNMAGESFCENALNPKIIFGEIPSHVRNCVYYHHIFDFSVVLAPLIHWRPGKLPGCPPHLPLVWSCTENRVISRHPYF